MTFKDDGVDTGRHQLSGSIVFSLAKRQLVVKITKSNYQKIAR